MSRLCWCVFFAALLILTPLTTAQNPPASNPQALALAAQSIAALTGGESISDVTLTGSVTWNGTNTGSATLRALGTGESRMDLALSNGARTEIRDSQTGVAIGQWTNPDSTTGAIVFQNCQTDAVWFFSALGSLAVGPNIVLTYIGQETRSGEAVQHIQSSIYDPNWPSGVTPTDQQLSTMDFYLDATTLLPAAVTFNAYPDNSTTTNLLVEIDFSNYQTTNGILVPMQIQKYQQGNLLASLVLSGASFNTGIPLSIFSLN